MQWKSACQAIPTFNSGSACVVWVFEEPSRFGARIDVFRPGRALHALPLACFPTASTSKRIRGQDSQASFQTISITQSRYIFRSVSDSSGFNWHVLFKSLTQRRCVVARRFVQGLIPTWGTATFQSCFGQHCAC